MKAQINKDLTIKQATSNFNVRRCFFFKNPFELNLDKKIGKKS